MSFWTIGDDTTLLSQTPYTFIQNLTHTHSYTPQRCQSHLASEESQKIVPLFRKDKIHSSAYNEPAYQIKCEVL